MEKGEIKMGKFNRVGKMVLIVVCLMIGLLLVLFISSLTFHAQPTGQINKSIDLLSEVDMTGTVKSISAESMVIGGGVMSDQTIALDENTKFQLRNPRTFMYEDVTANNVHKDQFVYVEMVPKVANKIAQAIKFDYLTNMGGRVKSIENNRIVLGDYLDQEILIDVEDSTQIFMLGKPNLLSLADIPLNNNVIVYSNMVYEKGKPLQAVWIDVLDDSLYVVPGENV